MPMTPVGQAAAIALSDQPTPTAGKTTSDLVNPATASSAPTHAGAAASIAKSQASASQDPSKTGKPSLASVPIVVFVAACLVAFTVLGVLIGLRMKKKRQKRLKPKKEKGQQLPTPYVEKIIPKEVCSEEYPDLEPVEQGWHVLRKQEKGNHHHQQDNSEHYPGTSGANVNGGSGRGEEPWTPPFAPMDILMLPPFGSRATTPLACDDGEEGRFLEGSSKSNSRSPATPLSPGSDEMTLPPPLNDQITITYGNDDDDNEQQYYYQQHQQVVGEGEGEEEEEEQQPPVNRSKHRYSRRRRSHRTQFSPAESPQPSPGLAPDEGQEAVVESELLKRRERRRMRKSKKQSEHLMVPQRYAKQETTDLARRRLAMACISNDDSDSNSDALIR